MSRGGGEPRGRGPRVRCAGPGSQIRPLCGGVLGVALLLSVTGGTASPDQILDLPQTRVFVDEMVSRHGFSEPALERLFAEARLLPRVVEAISRPAEAKPWHEYRSIFLTTDRIAGGVKFLRAHREVLERAEREYGVPAEIIAAIIGVETRYGRHTGRFPVVGAVATLAFQYPPRAAFFRGELEHLLLLSREEDVDPAAIKGSYAGAMGLPQFIASSYRSYAVDFDGDGTRDLWRSSVDAIGSVANYLSRHGWQRGRPVALRAELRRADDPRGMVERGLKPHTSLRELYRRGVVFDGVAPGDELGSLMRFETTDGYEHWVGLQNFYTITRYNHSFRYAMAVYQLAEEIRAGDDETNM